MNTLTLEAFFGGISRILPAESRIFGDLGIDSCCGGKNTVNPMRPFSTRLALTKSAKGPVAPIILGTKGALQVV